MNPHQPLSGTEKLVISAAMLVLAFTLFVIFVAYPYTVFQRYKCATYGYPHSATYGYGKTYCAKLVGATTEVKELAELERTGNEYCN